MIILVTLGKVRPNESPLRQSFCTYLQRISHHAPAEQMSFHDEAAFFRWHTRQHATPASLLVLLHPNGKLLTTKDLSDKWISWRDTGKRSIIVAIGPADGWSQQALGHADFLLSLGLLTLPHELAAVVAAEQVYRVLTILAGHPYHSGH